MLRYSLLRRRNYSGIHGSQPEARGAATFLLIPYFSAFKANLGIHDHLRIDLIHNPYLGQITVSLRRKQLTPNQKLIRYSGPNFLILLYSVPKIISLYYNLFVAELLPGCYSCQYWRSTNRKKSGCKWLLTPSCSRNSIGLANY